MKWKHSNWLSFIVFISFTLFLCPLMSRSLVWKLCWVQTTCGLCCWPWLWPPLSCNASCCLSVPRAPASCSSTSNRKRRHATVHNNTSINILQWHTTLLHFLLLCMDGLQHLGLHLVVVFLSLLWSLSEVTVAPPFFSFWLEWRTTSQ